MKTRIFYLYLQEMLSFCFPVHKHRKRPKTIKESKNIFHNTNHFIGVIFDEKLVLWANVGLLTTKKQKYSSSLHYYPVKVNIPYFLCLIPFLPFTIKYLHL